MDTIAPREASDLPALYHHCAKVFQALKDNAKVHQEDDGEGGVVNILVWEGFLTKMFGDLDLSVPYYTKCTQALKNMGCIRQLRRGGGNSPSQWEIIQSPTPALFDAEVPRKRRRNRTEALEDMVKDLQVKLIAQNQRLDQITGGQKSA